MHNILFRRFRGPQSIFLSSTGIFLKIRLPLKVPECFFFFFATKEGNILFQANSTMQTLLLHTLLKIDYLFVCHKLRIFLLYIINCVYLVLFTNKNVSDRIFIKLLHSKDFDWIWTGQTPYRLTYDKRYWPPWTLFLKIFIKGYLVLPDVWTFLSKTWQSQLDQCDYLCWGNT